MASFQDPAYIKRGPLGASEVSRGQGEDISESKITYVFTQHRHNRGGSSVKLDKLLVSHSLLIVQENEIHIK